MRAFLFMILAATGACVGMANGVASEVAAHRATALEAQLLDASRGVLVVAHRGCHAAATAHGLTRAVPENSLSALDRCIAIGADVMETDVRQAGDGTLVLFHDERVDRTTDGHGLVSELTGHDLQALHLKNDEGQAGQPLTDEHPATLEQLLAAAKGRILLNLDVKAPIYSEVADAVARAGMTGQVIIKATVGPASVPLAALEPFRRLHTMPILLNPHGQADLAATAHAQLGRGARPVAFELPPMAAAQLPGVVRVARQAHVRVFANTLWDGFTAGYGGDAQALNDPDGVWGRLMRAGVSMIQTDEPEALLAFRDRLNSAPSQ